MRAASLFTGIGGLDLALGVEPAAQVERDPYCLDVLALRWPGVERFTDVRDYHPSEGSLDLVYGGPPCFVAGTLIETLRGMVPIEGVVPGDMVLTHRQRWREVTTTMRREASATRSIKALGLRSTTTDEHPYWTRRMDRVWNNTRRQYDRVFGEPNWVAAEHLGPNDYVGLMADAHASTENRSPTVALAYLMGRWLADGWTRETQREGNHGWRHEVTIAVGKHREDRLREAFAEAGIHATRVEERTVVKYHAHSRRLLEALRPFGHLAHGKRVAVEVFGWDHTQRQALLDGWLVDGGVTVSRELAFGMARLARTLGLMPALDYQTPAPTIQIEGRTVNQRPWWRLRFHGKSKQAFFEDGVLWSPVRSTAPGGPATVYNLSVFEDESYVADGAIVHNCQPVSHAGRRKGDQDDRWLWPEALRVVAEARPATVFFENPMGIRTLGLDGILAELTGLGYGGAWEVVAAADVGAPHLRKRIFIMGILGRTGWEGPTRPKGNHGIVPGEVEWATPTAHPRTHTPRDVHHGRQLANEVAERGPQWPTPTASSGDRGGRGDLLGAVRGYPSPSGHLSDNLRGPQWPTPTTRDHKDTGDSIANGTVPVNSLLGRAVSPSRERGALSPDWCEWLMNLPIGWTDVLCAEPGPLYGWEAEPAIPRVGLGIPNRAKRLTALGNAVVPAQGAFAFRRLSERLASGSLWGIDK